MIDLDKSCTRWQQFDKEFKLLQYRNLTSMHEVLNFAEALTQHHEFARDCVDYTADSVTLDFSGYATLDDIKLPEDLSEEMQEALRTHFSDSYINEILSDASQREWEDKFCCFNKSRTLQTDFDNNITVSSHYSNTICETSSRLLEGAQDAAHRTLEAIHEMTDLVPLEELATLLGDVSDEQAELKSQFMDLLESVISQGEELYTYMAEIYMVSDILEYLEQVYTYKNSCENVKYILQSDVDNWLAEALKPYSDPNQLVLSL